MPPFHQEAPKRFTTNGHPRQQTLCFERWCLPQTIVINTSFPTLFTRDTRFPSAELGNQRAVITVTAAFLMNASLSPCVVRGPDHFIVPTNVSSVIRGRCQVLHPNPHATRNDVFLRVVILASWRKSESKNILIFTSDLYRFHILSYIKCLIRGPQTHFLY